MPLKRAGLFWKASGMMGVRWPGNCESSWPGAPGSFALSATRPGKLRSQEGIRNDGRGREPGRRHIRLIGILCGGRHPARIQEGIDDAPLLGRGPRQGGVGHRRQLLGPRWIRQAIHRTELGLPGAELGLPGTELILSGSELALPRTELGLSRTELALPRAGHTGAPHALLL
ncbi:hypothetical protein ACN28I_46075 [Archangium gephyra]|uniref:hypothetical protein n=1 Tax=Archangium gephyra TaxID=48 RepID=UPI003B762449